MGMSLTSRLEVQIKTRLIVFVSFSVTEIIGIETFRKQNLHSYTWAYALSIYFHFDKPCG